jgi:DNA repair protein RecN (Recombination protein N)
VIESLRIANLAVVEEVELEFGPGLNVLTGETGAGKSIVLGALGLLAGGRASADAVRRGAEQGVVEAVFRTRALPELEAELAARGLPLGDGELVVHRSVSRSGRSRARVAGELVPLATLQELLSGRIEISSQHSSQSLLRVESHGRLLDASGDLLAVRDGVAHRFAALQEARAELASLRSRSEERERRRDFAAFQLAEIEAANLEPGELERLGAEQARLAHAEELRREGAGAVRALSGDALESGSEGAADLVARARRGLEEAAELDPSLAPQVARLAALDAELRDAALDLERWADGIEVDPERLGEVEERIGRVEKLRRKYGHTIQAVLATRDELAAELASLEGAGDRTAELEERCGRLAAELEREAARLSRGRAEAARALSARVEELLRDLGMPKARFGVELGPAAAPEGLPCGPGGLEAPVFSFAANPGEPLRPLHKVASGGELSRVFLALRGALRRAAAGMVLVFDEVDAGIGGGVAERVGRCLAELAADHQVLCITHLPQIAACADLHFLVEKADRRGRSGVRVVRVEGPERVQEIARMAGGAVVSEATRRHAADLLRRQPVRSD